MPGKNVKNISQLILLVSTLALAVTGLEMTNLPSGDPLSSPDCDLTSPTLFTTTSFCTFLVSPGQTTTFTISTPQKRQGFNVRPALFWAFDMSHNASLERMPFSSINEEFPGSTLPRFAEDLAHFGEQSGRLTNTSGNNSLVMYGELKGMPYCGSGYAISRPGQRQIVKIVGRMAARIGLIGFWTQGTGQEGGHPCGSGLDKIIFVLLAVVIVAGILSLHGLALPCFLIKGAFFIRGRQDRGVVCAHQAVIVIFTVAVIPFLRSTPVWASVVFIVLPTVAIAACNVWLVASVPVGQVSTAASATHYVLWALGCALCSLATWEYIVRNEIYTPLSTSNTAFGLCGALMATHVLGLIPAQLRRSEFRKTMATWVPQPNNEPPPQLTTIA